MIKEKERGETTEYVYNLLKGRIFDWSLSPGEKINIRHLTREINISAIPLREALSRLHSEKLVVLEPNKGYRVSAILDDYHMAQMLEARILMETHAVRSIIRSNRLTIIDELLRLTERMFTINSGCTNKKILDFTHLDQQFHLALMRAGENPFIYEAYEKMHCHLHIGRFYHVKGEVDQKEAPSEHMNIIQAIRTRDVLRAEEAISSHIRDSIIRLLER
ncbi:GntR family transcriptional regulator [Fictibacillus sp. NRS-1165]|uniref:GntR family transcriptional regulator n=1 Tax=Fictibacillus sp. NRS-1165 TaxID=3144463 RepID=UPI003D2569C7